MTPAALAAAMEATWPAAAVMRLGPWTLRNGQGGGKRVSAATADGPWQTSDVPHAEAAMLAMGQQPLFLIREGDSTLDAVLAQAGYRVVDPVVAYAAPVGRLAPPPDLMAVFAHWPPLAIARDLWQAAGIGPARLAVMDRVGRPKAALLARVADRPAGVAFVALAYRDSAECCAMLHALEVPAACRRQGSAQNLLRAAAAWAQLQGADTIALVVTQANAPARALYEKLGLRTVGSYHYREA